jgi:hypothetical protein
MALIMGVRSIFVMQPNDPHPKVLLAASSAAVIEAALRSTF